ncbi:FIST N-terminal domain-containing protein [Xanthobacteraceae bacterium Astr-EGSB]|uniref:FIST signal transduction protein n=1 Tax=Astrobacterium formosum TaxID=3069710 RepID=UPI0027B0BF28|nr:FIST N-terminal domain-containing protein [Xanthobacteraceae bacterium Astr-EGSB]
MHVERLYWRNATGWSRSSSRCTRADLVLYFGGRKSLSDERHQELAALHPGAHILGCSSSGQIVDGKLNDDGIDAVAMSFDSTRVKLAREIVANPQQSRACGEAIGRALAADDLAGIFVLADGREVGGDDLVDGLADAVGQSVPVIGGMAADGADFAETLVGADTPPRRKTVGAVGFYGDAVSLGHGCAGGWDVFGPLRQVTRAEGNTIFEFDGEPALDLYERYLGEEEARGLPGTGLRFPLRLHDPDRPYSPIIRTVFAVDRKARSLTLGTRVPQGWVSQMMRGSFERLASGAARAARRAAAGTADRDGIAILVSCVGRRLLMGQRVADEVEDADAELGTRMIRLGFYSYGEIAPDDMSGICEMHNQTMVVATLSEDGDR